MDETKKKEIKIAINQINTALLAMEASGKFKYREKMHVSDKELREYFDVTKSKIYTAVVSNLILQEMFSEQLSDKKVYETFVHETEEFLEYLKAAGL